VRGDCMETFWNWLNLMCHSYLFLFLGLKECSLAGYFRKRKTR
jgi:hypothetical protein